MEIIIFWRIVMKTFSKGDLIVYHNQLGIIIDYVENKLKINFDGSIQLLLPKDVKLIKSVLQVMKEKLQENYDFPNDIADDILYELKKAFVIGEETADFEHYNAINLILKEI